MVTALGFGQGSIISGSDVVLMPSIFYRSTGEDGVASLHTLLSGGNAIWGHLGDVQRTRQPDMDTREHTFTRLAT